MMVKIFCRLTMMMMMSPKICLVTVVIAISLLHLSAADSKCFCQSDCEAEVRDCYKLEGETFGNVKADEHAPRAILACNSRYGDCTRKCQKVCRDL